MRDNKGRFVKGAKSEKRKEWNGKVFGKLTVLETKYALDGEKNTICRCKCTCGNEVYIPSCKLASGKRTSCGCDAAEKRRKAIRKDLTGMRFGRLVVEEMLWVDNGKTRCRCKCDCGKMVDVLNTQLSSGKTTSCGCYRKDQIIKSNTKDYSGKVASNGVVFLNKVEKNDKGVWMYDCKCPYCGNIFQEIPARINNNHITSCGCKSLSLREKYIEKILSENGVEYKRQYSFQDCKNVYPLRFDFAILNHDNSVKSLIEYDGAQHYRPVDLFGGKDAFIEQLENDSKKNKYCEDNHIPLFRIPFSMSLNDIEKTIMNIINP